MGPVINVNNYSGLIEMQDAFQVCRANSYLYDFVQSGKFNPSNPNLENDYFNLINNMTELEVYSGIDWSKIPSEWSEGTLNFKHNETVIKSIAIFSHLNIKF